MRRAITTGDQPLFPIFVPAPGYWLSQKGNFLPDRERGILAPREWPASTSSVWAKNRRDGEKITHSCHPQTRRAIVRGDRLLFPIFRASTQVLAVPKRKIFAQLPAVLN